MKKFIYLILAFAWLSWPFPVSAHLAGQPPFFRINGVYSNLYPVPTTSLNDFNLPQDLAADNYLVNQQLQFIMETNLLPVPAEIVKESKFDWDYGDGSPHGSGLTNTHTYTKMGSYILSINVTSPDTNQPMLLQSVLINVLPNKSYKLPQSVIQINGQAVKDPLTDVLKVNFNQNLKFDGSKSQSTSPITSYFWDFGDSNTSKKSQDVHQYNNEVHQYFPLLRIQTADGFIADSFVEVEEDDSAPLTPTVAATPPSNKKFDPKLAIGIGAIAAFLAVGWYLKTSKKTKH